jgi:predicted methyltransferase
MPFKRYRTIALLTSFAAMLALISSVLGCATAPAETTVAATQRYQKVTESPIRTDQDRGMDASRRPLEFLRFTEVRPGMQVLDVAAGGGYTSQLLALAVAPNGTLWAQREQPGAALTKRLADQPQANFVPVYRPFEDPVPPDAPKLDLITLVLNYHDISYLPVDRAKMNQRLFAALKPGGRFVVVDHSALPGTGITTGKSLHRIEEAFVVDEIRKAGFVLDAEGTFLRNAADPRDVTSNQPKIPTDKFALRFVKPR